MKLSAAMDGEELPTSLCETPHTFPSIKFSKESGSRKVK